MILEEKWKEIVSMGLRSYKLQKIKSKLLASILPLEADLMRHCGFVTAQKYHAVLSLLNLFFQIGIANVVLWRVV